MGTAQQIISRLQHAKLEGRNRYRSYSPLRPDSDGMNFVLDIENDEHGTWYDHKEQRGGSLYELAKILGIETPRAEIKSSLRVYSGLEDYANAHGLPSDVLRAAYWREVTIDNRPALEYSTTGGKRWRFIDGQKPKYKSERGYKKCWFGLSRANAIISQSESPLFITNGEISVITAQHYGIAAAAVPGGESALPGELLDELQEIIAPDTPIRIALDCDKTGVSSAKQLVLQLREAGFQDVVALDLGLSDKGDLADFCVLHQQGALPALAHCGTIEIKAPSSKYGIPRDKVVAQGTTWLTVAANTIYTLPPVSWIIKGEIPANSLTAIFGPSGVGKSFLALDYALRIAQRETVIYVAGEGEYGYAQRIRAWCQHHGKSEGKLYLTLGAVSLIEQNEVDSFIAAHQHLAPRIVIIDTLARAMLGADENSTRDMNQLTALCKHLMIEMNTAVLLVHHTGKMGAVERGSSVLRAACDSMLQLSDEDDLIRLESAKSKDARPFDARYLRLHTVEIEGVRDADGQPVYSPVMVAATIHTNTELDHLTIRQRKVLDCLNMPIFLESGATIADIAESTGVPRTNLYQVISRLLKNNLVEQEAPREPFRITKKGLDLLSNVSNVSDVSNVPVVFGDGKNIHHVTSVISQTTNTTDTSNTNGKKQARGNEKFVLDVSTEDSTKPQHNGFSGHLPGMEPRNKGVKD